MSPLSGGRRFLADPGLGPQRADQVSQRQQAIDGDRAAPLRDNHVRTGRRDLGPPARQAEQPTVLVVQMDLIFTPVLAVRDEVEVRAGLRVEPVRHPHAPIPIIWTGRRGRAVRTRSPNAQIGNARRECLDQLLIVGERHLRVLGKHAGHYNTCRPHRTLNRHPPAGRPPIACRRPEGGGGVLADHGPCTSGRPGRPGGSGASHAASQNGWRALRVHRHSAARVSVTEPPAAYIRRSPRTRKGPRSTARMVAGTSGCSRGTPGAW